VGVDSIRYPFPKKALRERREQEKMEESFLEVTSMQPVVVQVDTESLEDFVQDELRKTMIQQAFHQTQVPL